MKSFSLNQPESRKLREKDNKKKGERPGEFGVSVLLGKNGKKKMEEK